MHFQTLRFYEFDEASRRSDDDGRFLFQTFNLPLHICSADQLGHGYIRPFHPLTDDVDDLHRQLLGRRHDQRLRLHLFAIHLLEDRQDIGKRLSGSGRRFRHYIPAIQQFRNHLGLNRCLSFKLPLFLNTIVHFFQEGHSHPRFHCSLSYNEPDSLFFQVTAFFSLLPTVQMHRRSRSVQARNMPFRRA